jgi:hypothetical protein
VDTSPVRILTTHCDDFSHPRRLRDLHWGVEGLTQMSCKRCSSANLKEDFTGEIAIHFRGLAGLNKPIVWVFPQLVICLDCGFAEFEVPDEQLQQLREESQAHSA